MSTCLLLAVLIVVAGSTGCGLRSGETEDGQEVAADTQVTPQPVRVAEVEQGGISRTLDYVGTVQSEQTVQVVGRVAATAVEVYVDEGEHVSPQSALLSMESPELDAGIEGLEAEVDRARAEHDYLCDTFRTQRKLAEAGVATDATVDANESKCATSEYALAATDAARREASQRRDYLREYAPVDGVVLERMVEPGEYVTPGRPLFAIGTQEIEVRVMVTEGDVAAGLDVGGAVELTTTTGTTRSEVVDVAPVAEGPGRTIEIRVALPDELAADLRSGMSVDIAFILEESRHTTILGRDAVLETENGPVVFVVDGERLEMRNVELGVRTDERIEITSELAADATVVTGRLQALYDGQLVYPVQAGSAQ